MKRSLGLALVGDVALDAPLPDDAGVQKALSRLRVADIAFGNLETVVSRRGNPAEKLYNLRMDPDLLASVQQMGFTVMAVANNHALDYGVEAFSDTLTQMAACGILPVGGGQDLTEAWRPALIERDGVTVAFLAAACTLPPGFAAGEGRPGIAPIHVNASYFVDAMGSFEQPGTSPYVHTWAWPQDVQRAQAAIRAAKETADFLIMSIHWGVPPDWRAPYQGDLAEYQRPLGHALVEAGADVVVGHHPHSLQGIEVYQGKPIFHSLGNFAFGSQTGTVNEIVAQSLPYRQEDKPDRWWSESAIVEVTLTPGGAVRYAVWPVLLDEAGHPGLLEDDEAEALLRRLALLSAPLGGRLDIGQGRGRLL